MDNLDVNANYNLISTSHEEQPFVIAYTGHELTYEELLAAAEAP